MYDVCGKMYSLKQKYCKNMELHYFFTKSVCPDPVWKPK